MPEKCEWPGGIDIKPDGKNELDPCQYDEIAEYRNVTVKVWKCRKCGHIEYMWLRQPDTEEVIE